MCRRAAQGDRPQRRVAADLVRSEIESFSETNGAGGRAEGFGDFIDTSMCQAVNAPDRR